MKNEDKNIVVNDETIGTIGVVRSTRSRRVSISVRSTGEVRLSLPMYVSIDEGLRFARSKTDWILKAVERAKARRQMLPEADKREIERLRAVARERLPRRCEELSRQTGLKYRSVSVRAAHTRWGSCSSRDDISLSLFLVRLPDRLVDYVILHELCHTVHKNHSPRFHALLDSLLGGHEKELQTEIRRYRAF